MRAIVLLLATLLAEEAAGCHGLSKYWCRWYELLTDAVR